MTIKRFKKITFLIIVLLRISKVSGQEAFFNQYFSAKLFLNPALASQETSPTLGSNYRTQWKNTIIPYKTSQFSYIMPLIKKTDFAEKQGGSIGVSVYNDNAGEGNFKTLGTYFTYSFNFPISYDGKTMLVSFGLQGGVVQRQIDLSDLQWGSQYQPFVGYISTLSGESNLDFVANNVYPDFNAGFLFSYNGAKTSFKKNVNFHIGGAVYHLNTPDESFTEIESKLPRLLKLHSGLDWKIKERYKISPNVLLINQGDIYHINAGMYLSYQFIPFSTNPMVSETEFLFGSWYRFSDSFIFLTGFQNKNLTLGFSYDLNGSNLRSVNQGLGAYEISLTISQFKNNRLRKISTPRI